MSRHLLYTQMHLGIVHWPPVVVPNYPLHWAVFREVQVHEMHPLTNSTRSDKSPQATHACGEGHWNRESSKQVAYVFSLFISICMCPSIGIIYMYPPFMISDQETARAYIFYVESISLRSTTIHIYLSITKVRPTKGTILLASKHR